MSAGEKRPWAEAMEIAVRLANELTPVCTRVKVAGSLRRRRLEVGDIELVAEPRQVPVDLVGTLGPDFDGIRGVARTWGTITKGRDRHLTVLMPDGLQVDLFAVAPPAQWGSILAIRTGPGELGRTVMYQLQRRGLRHVAGHVEDASGRVIPTPEEEDLFRLAGLPFLPPEQRDTEKALRPIQAQPEPVPMGPVAAGVGGASSTREPKRRGRCADCEVDIPYDPTYGDQDRCNNCAGRYGQATAKAIAAGRRTSCGKCGKALDVAALLWSDEEICSTCRGRMKVGRPVDFARNTR